MPLNTVRKTFVALSWVLLTLSLPRGRPLTSKIDRVSSIGVDRVKSIKSLLGGKGLKGKVFLNVMKTEDI